MSQYKYKEKDTSKDIHCTVIWDKCIFFSEKATLQKQVGGQRHKCNFMWYTLN